MVNFWKRSMSMTPTFGKAAPKRSGRCVMTAPTSNPPLLPPPIASFGVDVNLLSIRYCAGRDEIIEHILFRVKHPGLMPFLAVLAAAPQVRNSVNAAHFHPDQISRRERRRAGNVEPAIAVKISRRLAVSFHSFFVWDKHRHARAIGALVKDLFSRVIIRIEFHVWLEQQLACPLVDIVAEDFRGRGETRKRVKRLAVFAFSGESGGSAKPRQRDLAVSRSVALEQFHRAVRVL